MSIRSSRRPRRHPPAPAARAHRAVFGAAHAAGLELPGRLSILTLLPTSEPSAKGHEIASRTSVHAATEGYPWPAEMAEEPHDAEVVEDAPEEERLDPELAARRAAALAH